MECNTIWFRNLICMIRSVEKKSKLKAFEMLRFKKNLKILRNEKILNRIMKNRQLCKFNIFNLKDIR